MEHPQAEKGQHVYFRFEPSSDYIELMFDTPQKYPCTGWTIEPHLEPCRVSIKINLLLILIIDLYM